MKKRIIIFAVVILALLIFIILRVYEPTPSDSNRQENFNETLFRAIKAGITPGHYLGTMVYFVEPKTKVVMVNPNNIVFHNCTILQETKNMNITLKNYPTIDPNFFQFIPLNRSFDENDKIFFECMNPHDITSWPKIYSDKTEYLPGDVVTIKGISEPKNNATIEIIDPDQTSDIIFKPNQTYYMQQQIKTGQDGSYAFSFKIPDTSKQGKWAVRVGDPIYYGDTLYFAVKPNKVTN